MRSFFVCLGLNLSLAQTKHSPPKTTNSPAQMLAQASDAVERGDLNNAVALVQKVLKNEPRSVAAHTLAGAIADRENDLPAAEKHFATAAGLAPNSPETRNNYGAILLRLNRQTEAGKEFAAALAANPNQPSALINLAQIRFDENNLLDARRLFERAKQVAPDLDILRALVAVSLELNETERAKKELSEYLATRKSLAIVPNTPGGKAVQSEIELGRLLLSHGLFDEARQDLELIATAEPQNVDAVILLAKAYHAEKNIRAAGKVLESAVVKGTDDPKIYAALAETYEAGGYLENAVPVMLLAIEKDPRNEFYRARYGLLLISAQAPAAAIIRLKEAVQEMPSSARLWLALGIAQLTEGRVAADAQKSFEQSLKLEPKSIPALAYLGTIYTDAANYAEAAKFYERALAIEEKNALLHYLLADTLLKIPASDQALIEEHLRHAVLLDPKLAVAHFALGKFYARLERWPQAGEEFRQAVVFAPDLAEAHYQLGRTLARLKRLDESKLEFEQYKKLSETQTVQKEIDRRELVRRLANVRF